MGATLNPIKINSLQGLVTAANKLFRRAARASFSRDGKMVDPTVVANAKEAVLAVQAFNPNPSNFNGDGLTYAQQFRDRYLELGGKL